MQSMMAPFGKLKSRKAMQNLNYDPRKASLRRNAIIWFVFCVLLGGGFWYSLTTTLDDMTKRDCKAGVQRACDSLQMQN